MGGESTHPDAVAEILKRVFAPGDVFEIRALDATRPGFRRPHTESGYFDYDHMDDAALAVAELSSAKGVYYTPNPVLPALLARAANRIRPAGNDPASKDDEVIARRWLLIDCDPIRPTGISSTDEEHDLAHARAREIREGLASMGWPEPIFCDSGNGGQLMYRVDLPCGDDGLVQRVLSALSSTDDEKVQVDQSVFNPARLWRLPGTMNCRGDHVPERPHRRARVIDMPETLAVVTREQLEAVAGTAPTEPASAPFAGVDISGIAGPAPAGGETFDIDAWIARHCPGVEGPSSWKDGRKWIFPVCPFNEAHTNRSAVIIEQGSGAIAFRCHHNGCRNYGWKELRELKEPNRNIPSASPALVSPATTPVEPDPEPEEEPDNRVPDPGPMPEELLRIPGFVSEVMDFCLETAPYPNPVMAFCGALALQGFLAGRKVRDPGDNRTNLYLLGLAHSAAGKDWPRKINTRILHEAGLSDCLGDRFASGEGIQDALYVTPCMLFQTDEIDGMLQQISKSQDGRHENIMGTLLTLYTSSNSVFPMRRKAGKESAGSIDQPCLTVFGTAIPQHYYEALSLRMLTNGFFARMLILEAGKRSEGQEPSIRDSPERVMEAAKWWHGFQPGKASGNLSAWHPVPIVVEHTKEAKRILVDLRREAEHEYGIAEDRADEASTTVWGRVNEQARKLALIHAVSEDHQNPSIGRAAAEWASRFVLHQTRRMLFMAQSHVSANDFDGRCKELIRVLREAHQSKKYTEWVPFWLINRKLPWSSLEHKEVRETLMDQMRIECEQTGRTRKGGRPGWRYRLQQ